MSAWYLSPMRGCLGSATPSLQLAEGLTCFVPRQKVLPPSWVPVGSSSESTPAKVHCCETGLGSVGAGLWIKAAVSDERFVERFLGGRVSSDMGFRGDGDWAFACERARSERAGYNGVNCTMLGC